MKLKDSLKLFFQRIGDWIYLHKNTSIGILIGVLAVIIVLIAVPAAKRKAEEPVTEPVEMTETDASQEEENVPYEELQMNAYPEINSLVLQYYDAMVNGDTEALKKIMDPVSDTYLMRFEEVSKYVDGYTAVMVYTKPGPKEGSFVAFTETQIIMTGYPDKGAPGLTTFYICQREDGSYYFNNSEELSAEEAEYICQLDLQDDVIDLNNRVSVAFNNLLAEDEAFAKNYTLVNESITKGLQESMQQAYNEEVAANEAEQEEQPQVIVKKIVKANTVVNKRSSDSELSDKMGKAQINDTFTVLEEKANGWTKLTDGKDEFFIKTEFLDVVSETSVEAVSDDKVIGTVKATTNINVRNAPSETGEKLGKVSSGTSLEVLQKDTDGWTTIRFNGQMAYVKSEFVE